MDHNLNSDSVLSNISNKINEIKDKITLNEEKKLIFDSKINEKLKDMHLKNVNIS